MNTYWRLVEPNILMLHRDSVNEDRIYNITLSIEEYKILVSMLIDEEWIIMKRRLNNE